MKRKLPRVFFINLPIDQLWGIDSNLKKIFFARIPESESATRSFEDLSAYLISESDIAFCSPHITDDLRKITRGRLIGIKANPYDFEDWVAEAMTHLDPRVNYEFWPCGLSVLEETFLHECPQMRLPQWLPRQFAAKELNRKSKIFDWQKITALAIPDTEIATLDQLSDKRPIILKSEWGSGGGGNFLIENSDDPKLKWIERQISKNEKWLCQKPISSAENFSCFGWAAEDSSTTFAVSYDAHGTSLRHQVAMHEVSIELNTAFKKVAAYLRLQNYGGPFGFDVIRAKNIFYLIDMNIRWTKTHLIAAAAEVFGIDMQNILSLRAPRNNVRDKKHIYLAGPKEVSYFEIQA